MTYRDSLGLKPRKNEEDLIQIALVEHIRLFAVKDLIWYMVPNGTNKSKAAAGRAKAMGLRAGVYDLAGALPGGQAWFLEIKTRTGKLSDSQIDFGELCERNGSLHQVCYSLDTALVWLRAIGALKPERRGRIAFA